MKRELHSKFLTHFKYQSRLKLGVILEMIKSSTHTFL